MKKFKLLLLSSFVLFGCGQEKELTKVDEKFQQPYTYIGQSVNTVAKKFSVQPNSVGNLIIDSNLHHFLFESSDGVIVSYVDVRFKETTPCDQKRNFDSIRILRALGIKPDSLELVRKRKHFHTYYDHKNKLKVGVSCLYDGASLNASFSRKYYGQ
ncbi:hypothetical protein L4D00_11825 [Photobacterium swingsii]|uniref:hypothetical protein n=1 Tax=Photobacterium swingsii TaxID=680026 RepID=UPI003D09ED9A